MTDDEIRALAWKAVIDGGEDHADVWIDEEDDYPDLDIGVMRYTMYAMTDWMHKQPPPPVEVKQ
jgi:hypothetical protein